MSEFASHGFDPNFDGAGATLFVAEPDLSHLTDEADRAEAQWNFERDLADVLHDVGRALDLYSEPHGTKAVFDGTFDGVASNAALGVGIRKGERGFAVGVAIGGFLQRALTSTPETDLALVEETGRAPAVVRKILRAYSAAAVERVAIALLDAGHRPMANAIPVPPDRDARRTRAKALDSELASLAQAVRNFQNSYDNFATLSSDERMVVGEVWMTAIDADLKPFFHVDVPVYDRKSKAMLFVRDGDVAIGPYKLPAQVQLMLHDMARYGDFLGVSRDGDTEALYAVAQTNALAHDRRRPSLVLSPDEYVHGVGYELRIDPEDGRIPATIQKKPLQSLTMAA